MENLSEMDYCIAGSWTEATRQASPKAMQKIQRIC